MAYGDGNNEGKRLTIKLGKIYHDVEETVSYLALVRNTGVEAVVEVVALEADVFGHSVVEGVAAEVVAVELSRQVRVVDVVFLRVARQQALRLGDRHVDCAVAALYIPLHRHHLFPFHFI